jgi:predicted short-subunit dehydrogenase-like oxidoreductase (DUF2520 family)
MRQVPTSDASPIGIVGNGRVASHFRHYFSLLGVPFQTWSRQESTATPPDAFAACRTVVLLIRDKAIVPFIDTWPALRDRHLVHCSGSLVTPMAAGAHPLMTFGPTLYALHDYRAIPFVLDTTDTSLADLLPGLPNPWFTIPRTERAYYHALCVMAGNFSVLLWSKLFDEFETRFGLPRSAAFPYLERVTANLMTDAEHALTGPLSRGDAQAIAANVAALDGDPFQAVYEAFVRAYEKRP